MITDIKTFATPARMGDASEVTNRKLEELMRSALVDMEGANSRDESQDGKEQNMKILMDAFMRDWFNKALTEKPDDWEF